MSVFRGRILAAGTVVAVAAGVLVAPSPAAAATVCNRFCDGRDAAQAGGDRTPVRSTLYGRTFTLHVDDANSMGWATIEGGKAGDETWLDRSFDGGRTWAGNSRLGNTVVPAGATSGRSPMYNVDDWANRGVGALRACGKAGDRPEVACTAWARSTWNAAGRSRAAATAMMMRYDQNTGLFDGNAWWTSANAMSALIENIRVSGMDSYRYAIATTYDKQVNSRQGQFRNEYIDDTGWWGLAWIAAYDLTGDSRYLDTARADADHMHAYWDGTCGGGVWWKTDRSSKVAIANSLYIQLNAELAQRLTGTTVYRDRARAGWSWFAGTGMLTSANIVIDRISPDTCRATSGPLTYNSGVLMNALVQLNRATGDAGALTVARRVGDASTTHSALNSGGILREPGEGDSCQGDQPSWKGAYARGLGVLNRATGGAYNAYLQRQATSAYTTNRNALDEYGIHWAGPFVPSAHACQHAALDLLNAAS
ncbi:glycoside hydrolase family 76 protein [Actinoplanes sp. TRM 88003]|uniref:Glycoside hydrolase family 76 protein n=1 Tax=Paractinoplanes aksuensis TaxID=2939490 RepID=A0ABT1DS44_9ACTN|nr:glycoside hydrolase family 76 protein [Actinoplanes aksuensis]MCO8273645.1 glycoside hydrolase family 76 protein [Actinoplanes aksuensis]